MSRAPLYGVVLLFVFFCLGTDGAFVQPSHAPAITTVCTPCHGTDGAVGDVDVPNLAGQKSIYIREQLLAFRAGSRKHPEMRTVGRTLTDREIDQIVVYYSTLVPR